MYTKQNKPNPYYNSTLLSPFECLRALEMVVRLPRGLLIDKSEPL